MLKLRKSETAFTLLEIIVVIVIVGVLASQALPKMIKAIEMSRSTEAMNIILSIRKSIEQCHLMNNASSYVNCTEFDSELNIEDPSLTPGSHFNYQITAGSESYRIVATRNNINNGDGFSTVFVESNTSGIQKGGTGAYATIQ